MQISSMPKKGQLNNHNDFELFIPKMHWVHFLYIEIINNRLGLKVICVFAGAIDSQNIWVLSL